MPKIVDINEINKLVLEPFHDILSTIVKYPYDKRKKSIEIKRTY
jgi:hypothetical protein